MLPMKSCYLPACISAVTVSFPINAGPYVHLCWLHSIPSLHLVRTVISPYKSGGISNIPYVPFQTTTSVTLPMELGLVNYQYMTPVMLHLISMFISPTSSSCTVGWVERNIKLLTYRLWVFQPVWFCLFRPVADRNCLSSE